MTFEQALSRFTSFDKDISRLYSIPMQDYRGRTIHVDSVRKYLGAEKYRFAEIATMLPLPSKKGSRLLDIGIAYGFLSALLKSDGAWNCEGLELAENIPVYCSFAQNHKIPVHAGKLGIKPLPFANDSFQAILFSEVLEHLRISPQIVLREFHRILSPEGWLIVTTPNLARLTNILKLMLGRNVLEEFPEVESENITEYLTHIREYTMSEICALLERNHFIIRQARFSLCMEQHRLHRWITSFIPPWRGNLMILAQKKLWSPTGRSPWHLAVLRRNPPKQLQSSFAKASEDTRVPSRPGDHGFLRRRVKICFLLSTFVYDGIKRSVVHFANTIQEMGHEVWIGVLHEWPGKVSLRSELKIPEERIVSWDGLGQGMREWAMYRFFCNNSFDVIHANTIKMNHVGRWMALAARVPCIIASEDNLCLNRSWKTRMEDRILARLGHGVVMISKAVADSFIEVENLPRNKVHTIYYGLPIQVFQSYHRTAQELEAKRKELKIPQAPTVVCAARLHFSKSLETFIEAAHVVLKQLPNAQFLLAGDGEERAKLENLRNRLSLKDHFHFIGARNDIYDIFQLANVVALCSLWEGLGFSLMEGMALGKPLVGTDVAGINEIIEHGQNGLLVPPKSPELLAKAFSQILTDSALAEKMKHANHAILSERFDVTRNAQKLVTLYQNILNQNRP